MCGRFAQTNGLPDIARMVGVKVRYEVAPRYNIAPTQEVGLIHRVSATEPPAVTKMRWGLVPSWSKTPNTGNRLINARSETAHEKPAFRSAFQSRRCLVPADGFYEWQGQGKHKQPFYIRMTKHAPFALGGLWDVHRAENGNQKSTFTILTTEPNDIVRPIHNRMPVIIDPDRYDEWLDPTLNDPGVLGILTKPYPGNMAAIPVGSYVGNIRNDGPQCIEPVVVEEQLSLF